jgi:hypothetical protein
MERAEIAELFYGALIGCHEVEQLFRFLSPKVEWILSAADPQTLGEESPQNAIKFSGREGFLWLIKARLVTGKLMCKLNGRQVVSKVLVALA